MITHEDSLLSFDEQIKYSLNEFDSNKIPKGKFENIILCGLGGSGIGGRIARGYFLNKSTCPIEVYSDYFLPKYINSNTLVVLSSYSGNTEETLSMFEVAKEKGCQMIGICSGGELANKLKSNNLSCFTVPVGYQPRMALGFSLTLNVLILDSIFRTNIKAELQEVLSIYENKDALQIEARKVFENLFTDYNNPTHIYCDEHFSGVATRFCQQIQENAKGQAFSFVLPEVNHNVTESIYDRLNANILFLNSETNSRTNKRFEFLKNLLMQNGNKSTSLSTSGTSLKELYRVIYLLDWVSIYLSDKKGVNNMKVDNIDKLKEFLNV